MGPHHYAAVQRHRHGLVPRTRHHLPSHIGAEPHHRDRHRRLHDTAYLYGICPCCRHDALFLAPHDGRARRREPPSPAKPCRCLSGSGRRPQYLRRLLGAPGDRRARLHDSRQGTRSRGGLPPRADQ